MPAIYNPLSTAKGSIRLLSIAPVDNTTDIHCQLSPDNIHTSTFKALSYVWGQPQPLHSIQVNGKEVKVRRNLYHFLRKAQNLDLGLIWIDALCINQDDISERSSQVQQMAQIYRNACEVIVWLGEDAAAADLTFFSKFDTGGSWCGEVAPKISDPSIVNLQVASPGITDQTMFERFAQLEMHVWQGLNDLDDEVEPVSSFGLTDTSDHMHQIEEWSDADREVAMALFDQISAHPYWTRAWIVQEFLLARSLWFLFSSTSVTLDQFKAAFSLLEPYDENTSEANRRLSDLLYSRDDQADAVTDLSKTVFPDSLFDLLKRFGQRNCSDVRDRIYALLGMSEEAKRMQVDYALSKPELFMRALQAMHESSLRVPQLLFESLEISIDDIVTTNAPQATFSYPFAGGHFILDGTGPKSRFEVEVEACCCMHCRDLDQVFHSNKQYLILRSVSTVLYLIYGRTSSRHNDVHAVKDELSFIACATSAGRGSRRLCAYMPDGDIQSMFYGSKIVMEKGVRIPTINLSEKSIFAHTYCISRQCDEAVLTHKTLERPRPDQEIVGRLYHEWDWTR